MIGSVARHRKSRQTVALRRPKFGGYHLGVKRVLALSSGVVKELRVSGRRALALTISETKIAQRGVIVRAAAERPMIFALVLLDRKIVYARDAQTRQSLL